jgi:hypothetical protein
MLASEGGHLAVVRKLLTEGSTVDARNQYGSTALMRAAAGGHADVVNALLKAAADIDATGNDGLDALMCAARFGHAPVTDALLRLRSNVEAKAENGSTAITIAKDGGHIAVLQVLGIETDVSATHILSMEEFASMHNFRPSSALRLSTSSAFEKASSLNSSCKSALRSSDTASLTSQSIPCWSVPVDMVMDAATQSAISNSFQISSISNSLQMSGALGVDEVVEFDDARMWRIGAPDDKEQTLPPLRTLVRCGGRNVRFQPAVATPKASQKRWPASL